MRVPRRDRKHLKHLGTFACCVPGCEAPAVPHHVRTAANSGMGLKPPDRGCTVPMCHGHHTEGHDRGWLTFQRKYGIDLAAEADFYGRTSGQEMP